MFEYIEAFYNRQRRHSTLDMLSPANYTGTRTSNNVNGLDNAVDVDDVPRWQLPPTA